MAYTWVEGDVVLIQGFGVVRIRTIYPSGSVSVEDANGVRWLFERDWLEYAEPCLFTERKSS